MSHRICVVPITFTLADYERDPCGSGAHYHLSHSALKPFLEEKRVVILQGSLGLGRREELRQRVKTVVWIVPVQGSVTNHPKAGMLNRGLSFRYGEYLAMRVRQEEDWAIAMKEQIAGAREARRGNLATNLDCA